MRSPSSHEPRSRAVGDGARAHRISRLTLFVGIPAAYLLANLWSVVVGTSSMSGTPPVVGWRGVFVDLPGSLLMLGVAIVSLVFAARALRAGAPRATLGLWLSAGGLLLVLLVIGTVSLDEVTAPHQGATRWVVWGAAVVLASLGLLVARAWARKS